MNNNVGHRKRLRARFEKNEFNGFNDYEILELLLTFVFRQGDVKPLAKELIKTFGSYSNVLDAQIEELEKVKGLGRASALSLRAFRQSMAYYFQDRVLNNKDQLTKMSSLIEFLQASICQKPNEVIFSIFLNAKNEVLAIKELGEGSVSEAVIIPRKILEESLKLKATSIILAHNHPDGMALPSEQDKLITSEILKALSLVEISLQDHIIIANKEYYSFKRNNLI